MLTARRAASVLVTTWMLGSLAGQAVAERRSFGVAEDVDLADAGAVEIRYASTHGRDAVWSGLGELTYGISRRWDVAFMQSGNSSGTAALTLGDAALRLRFKPVERGDLPVDLRVEATLAKSARTCRLTGDPKIVIGRNLWKLRVVANVGASFGAALGDPALDCGHGTDVATDLAATWAGAVRFRLRPTVDVSVEAFGRIDDVAEGTRAVHAYVGPAVSWAPRPRLYVTGSAGFGLGDDASDVLARFMLGLVL